MNGRFAVTGRARRYAADAARAFEHAPVEVSISLLLAVTLSYAIEQGGDAFPTWLELAVPAFLAACVAFTATLLHALGRLSARVRRAVTLAGGMVAALYAALVIDFTLAAEAWRAAMLVGAALLLVAAAPALAAPSSGDTGDRTDAFRLVAGRLLLRTIAVLIYAGALYAGLALALGAVNTLFELQLDAAIYAHVFGWIALVLVPWVVAGGVPDYVRPRGVPSEVGAVVQRIAAFLVVPLLAIYYLILYAYAVRIGLTGELPKNLVSPLVIAAGLIGAVALVLFDPRPGERSPLRALPVTALLFVPLAALGVWALVMRLDQYGWTEFRAIRTLLLVTLAIAAMLAAVLYLRGRRLPLHLLPLGLAAVMTLAAIGPWSVQAVSRRSQQARLDRALIEAGTSPDARMVTDSILPGATYDAIDDIARYLVSHHGRGALPPLLAQHVGSPLEPAHYGIAERAGFRRESGPWPTGRRLFAQLPAGATFGDDGGRIQYVRIEPVPRPGAAPAAGTADSLRVRLSADGIAVTGDLEPLLRVVEGGRFDNPTLPPQSARVPLLDTLGVQRAELIVLEVAFGPDAGSGLVRLEGIVRLPR